MSKLCVRCFGLSLDGYGAGPDQDLQNPHGVGGGGTTDINDEFAQRGFANVGAWILGRNMFGPIRGAWPDDQWKGWWGDNPPYHTPVFVLTHHPRASIKMDGGTIFHF